MTLYNFNINNTDLHFTINENSITISPIRAAQNRNNNIVADNDDGDEGVDNNNNNGVGDEIELVPNGNGGDDDRAEFFDLHDFYFDEDDINNAGLELIIYPDENGLRHYGISLNTLPTLPAYINLHNVYYNSSIALLINSDTSVFLIRPAPPLAATPLDNAANNNNNNNEDLSLSITIPFILILPFNIANTNTIINIYIRISPNGVKVHATTQAGVTDCVAYLEIVAPPT
ncbi:unnamed protein product [Lupinus luteus]|uniref:Uncharacterized protein n=1 Tax=Lupinus luteus TaxID=3873 RepID=A0AAV1Y1J5_LUPLU